MDDPLRLFPFAMKVGEVVPEIPNLLFLSAPFLSTDEAPDPQWPKGSRLSVVVI